MRDIEEVVVWALRDQQAHRLTGGAIAEFGWLRGGTATAAICRHVALGVTVGGGGADIHDAPDHAVRIAEAVRALPMEARRLVLQHGRAGTRPDWRADWAVQYRRAGERVVAVEEGVIVTFTPVRLHLEDTAIRWARAEWTLWREALVALAAEIGADPPAVAAAPWESDPIETLLTNRGDLT